MGWFLSIIELSQPERIRGKASEEMIKNKNKKKNDIFMYKKNHDGERHRMRLSDKLRVKVTIFADNLM